ncbi:MAG: hypothetical protein HYU64_02395 [Armatimonadetes bacterium]|nr:hypothetical protein [Armatimonadota bacterium]
MTVQTRICCWVILLLLLVSGTISWISITYFRHRMMERLQYDLFKTGQTLALVTLDAQQRGQPVEALRIYVDAVKERPEAVAVGIMDSHGKVLMHNNPSEIGKKVVGVEDLSLFQGSRLPLYKERTASIGDFGIEELPPSGRILDVLLPVFTPAEGYVRICASLAAFEKDLAIATSRVLFATVLLTALAAGLILLGTRRAVQTLQGLVGHIHETFLEMVDASAQHASTMAAVRDTMSEVAEGASRQQEMFKEAETIVTELSEVIDLAIQNVDSNEGTVVAAMEEVQEARKNEEAVLSRVAKTLRDRGLDPNMRPVLFVALEQLSAKLKRCSEEISLIGTVCRQIKEVDHLLGDRIVGATATSHLTTVAAYTTSIALETMRFRFGEITGKFALLSVEGRKLLREMGIHAGGLDGGPDLEKEKDSPADNSAP